MAQVRRSRDGKMVEIDQDVLDIAAQLRQIDPLLHIRWSELAGHFVVYCREESAPEGRGHLVTTAQELDQRLVRRIEEIAWKQRQSSYSFADELEKVEADKDKAQRHHMHEEIGERAERLAHALRKDLGVKGRIYVPD
jgi:hypothetical protein